MVGGNFRVNFHFLVTLTIIAISLALSTKTENLPRKYGKNPSKGIAEIKPSSRSLINGRADISYRLPNNTEPIHYNIELTTHVHNGTRDFTGLVEILLTAVEDTRTIILHALELEDFQASIKNADLSEAIEYPVSWSYEEEREFLSLSPNDTNLNLKKGTNWTLTINYKGQLASDLTGFHMQNYTDSNKRIHYLAVTQFESAYARMAFPCYDEPAKRATFTVTIKHHPSYNALSNMPKNESASSNGVTVFDKTTVTMPTYLVAFHVSDFEFTEGELHSLPHRLYTRPEVLRNQDIDLVSGMVILQYLTNYYKVPYDLPRLVQVVVPEKEGGMENWGLAIYGERDMLLNKTTSTTSTLIDSVTMIAHECVHQWLGNHVTVRWWTYLWLKEGFATLYSYDTINEIYPEWDVYQLMHTDIFQAALTDDGSGNLTPMTHYVQTRAEIKARYDGSSYAKPASVLHMWRHALGDVVFRASFTKYLNDYAFSSTEEWQLFAAIQSAVEAHRVDVPAAIDVMFPTWTTQTGYPLLTVSRNYTSKTFTVTQTAYNDNKTIASSKTYYVPFNYATHSKADFRNTKATHYLHSTEEIIIEDNELGADDWLILNKQSTGYFRINYDVTNWHLIAQSLVARPNRIHSRNRAQLLNDAYALVTTERLQQDILLELLTYLPGEDQYAPWHAANAIITAYNEYLSGDPDYSVFKQFIASLVSNIYETLGVNELPGEQVLRKFTRNRAVNLACLAGVEQCLLESNEKLKVFMNDGIAIEPNVQQQAYCNGLRQSSDTEYNYFFNDLLQSSSNTEYHTYLLEALGCSEKESQLQKFLKLSIDTNNLLNEDDRTSILKSVYSRSELGFLLTTDFLDNNWEAYGKLSSEVGSTNPLSEALVDMANYVNNIVQQNKLLALVDKVKNSSLVDSNLEDAVKANMQVNFDWLDKNREPIMSFIKNYLSIDSAACLDLP